MRYLASEHPIILGKFETGSTVTISLYDLSDSSTVTLTSNSCSEIASTGIFKWSTSDITTQPTAKAEYLWIMDDGNGKQYGKIVLGGYIDDILSDTNELQMNQGNWLTATGFATQNPPSQNLDDYKADISGLSTFDPATDTVARVTLVDTTTANTDMRGTDGANTVVPDNAGIAAIPTNPLLTNDARLNHLDADITSRQPVVNVPTVDEIDAKLVSEHGAGAWTSASGGGDWVVEGTITAKQALRLLVSRAAGEASGGDTAQVSFKSLDGSKDRIVMDVDSKGNRSSVVIDVS